jgi:hypothetical protein
MSPRVKQSNLQQVIFQIKVTLKYSEPEIWRTILVPGGITLHKFHNILQIVMGWYNEHLYNFFIGGCEYGIPASDFNAEFYDSRKVKLDKAVGRKKKFDYVYDFGDNWEHEIRVEKMLKADTGKFHPFCVGGERACPPEDVGGIGGYEDFLAAYFDPSHEEHENLREWAGDDFEPERFDLESINERLRKLR